MIDGRCEPACRHDRGREAVYAAEETAFGGTDLEDPRPLGELRARAAAVVDGDWWTRAGGQSIDLVAARADARSSTARGRGREAVIHLATAQRDTATMAHELAHVLAGIDRGHDELFRAAHVDVVAVLSGSGASASLARAYRAFGLDVGPRTWPPPVRGVGDSFVIVP
jgi:hypothetical protein